MLAPGHAQPPAGPIPPHAAAYDKLKPAYLFLYDKVQAGWSYWYAIKTTPFRTKANFKATSRQTAIPFAEALEGVVKSTADEAAEALLLLMSALLWTRRLARATPQRRPRSD